MKRLAHLSMYVLVAVLLALWSSSHGVAKASPNATLIVNDGGDTNARDGVLTLREAILVARGDLTACLSDAERGQMFGVSWDSGSPDGCNNITGGAGFFDSDWIIFTGGLTNIFTFSALPHLYCNDWISSGFGTSRSVTIDGSSAGNVDGLTVECPTPSSVLGGFAIQYLSVVDFDNDIKVMGAYTGTLKGLVVSGACHDGIVLTSDSVRQRNSRNNVIGGTTVSDRNYIYDNGVKNACGPGDGIGISGDSNFDSGLMNNQIIGSYIGLTTSGTAAGNERQGIYLQNAWYNAIGGSTAASGNVISANGSDGIKLEGADTNGNGIYNNLVGLNPTATVTLGNVFSGISIISGAHDNLIGSLAANGNTIAGNEWGVFIGSFGSNSNSVAYNRIGTNAANAGGMGNTIAGVGLYDNVAFNDIGTNGGNTISGNAIGVEVKDGGTNFNHIANNKIGLNSAGNGALANGTGIKLSSGVHLNDVNLNTISGNTTDGVLLDGSGTLTNTLRSNKIGTNITGTGSIPNASSGVQIQNGASANIIGLAGQGNLISGNTGDGVQISGSGTNFNALYANTIGLNASGTAKLPNGQSGVAILGGAAANRVGGGGKGNTIAGNGNAGVFIANPNTISTFVFGNNIGTNGASATGLGNVNAGIGIYNGATFSFIGEIGSVFEGAGNVISGNGGPGIDIANGGTRYNFVYNNLIGTNAAGTGALGNSIGIRLFGGTTNNTLGFPTAGRANLISGNAGPGVGLYNTGTTTNTINSNLIGTNLAGTAAISNTQQGIIIQEASASNIITGNVVSGNGADGININGSGTDLNVVSNNKIGTNAAGSGAIPNTYDGVAVTNGPISTTIGGPTLGDRNLISGNRTDGVYVQDANTVSTTIRMNYIGLDASGTLAIPNGLAGIAIINASGTLIGSNTDGGGRYQYISGNGQQGIYISGASGTQIAFSTRIGYAADGVSPLGNSAQGIALNNTVNTVIFAIIAYNGGAGVSVTGNGAANNLVHPLNDRLNGGLAIDLGNDGFTPNGTHVGPGPNGWLAYPVIISATNSAITGTTCANCVVAGYLATGFPNAPGGGGQFTGAIATANGSGMFTMALINGMTPSNTTLINCQLAPLCGGYSNTSEFSPLYLPMKVFLPLVRR